MKFALFDDPAIREQLLPFTYTRPVAELRWGILTISEKWQHWLEGPIGFVTSSYLQEKYPKPPSNEALTLINGAVVPSTALLMAINQLGPESALRAEGRLIAARVKAFSGVDGLDELKTVTFDEEFTLLERNWHIFKGAGEQIRHDFDLLTKGRQSAKITDPHTRVYNLERIFIEPGVNIKAAILDADNGPIYLGRNTTIEAGAVIKGPFGLGEGSTINGLAHMRGDIAIGPYCKVGGEVSNSIIFGYSNKGHDGFLGNSVLGEWCNIGAGTNTSNLKNNYAKVKIWDYAKGGFLNTGEQFCGLMMGDHSKSGIGTIFNTGTVTGVGANIFGAGFPRNFIPSFAWGGHSGFSTFNLAKVREMATVSMARRDKTFDSLEENILNHVYRETAVYRNWEK